MVSLEASQLQHVVQIVCDTGGGGRLDHALVATGSGHGRCRRRRGGGGRQVMVVCSTVVQILVEQRVGMELGGRGR